MPEQKVLSEIDKHIKTKVVTEAIRIVTGQGTEEFLDSYQQILPVEAHEEDQWSEYYVWNKA